MRAEDQFSKILTFWGRQLISVRLLMGVFQDGTLQVVGLKLDRVGPVDTRPSTNKLHHFMKKKKSDMWHVWVGEHSLKISAP